MRGLLDSNVIVSAIMFGGVPRRVLQAALIGDLDVVTSPVLMSELEAILIRKFKFRSTVAAATRAEFESLAEVVEPATVLSVLSDSADDEVLAAALMGRAAVIVTGDKELLDLGQYEGIRIVSPRVLLDELAEQNDQN